MLIRYIGARVTRRLVGQYEWSVTTGFVQDVDAATAVELLTEPGGAFVVDQSEPLLALSGVDVGRVGELALAGVGGLADLAALSSSGTKALAKALTWAGESTVKQWVRQAGGGPVTQDSTEEV